MKAWTVNIIMVAVGLLALGGCSTVPAEQLSEKYDRPILSAAQAKSMIRVEVTELAPVAVDEAVVASAHLDHLR
ncbi:MAG: hypothetical protein WBN44_02385 [Woeseiaceae bacterium]